MLFVTLMYDKKFFLVLFILKKYKVLEFILEIVFKRKKIYFYKTKGEFVSYMFITKKQKHDTGRINSANS